MNASFRPRTVWFVLLGLTLLAYAFQLGGQTFSPKLIGSAILVAAFVKVRLIGLYFMELKGTVLPLRIAFEVWVVALAVTLIALFAIP